MKIEKRKPHVLPPNDRIRCHVFTWMGEGETDENGKALPAYECQVTPLIGWVVTLPHEIEVGDESPPEYPEPVLPEKPGINQLVFYEYLDRTPQERPFVLPAVCDVSTRDEAIAWCVREAKQSDPLKLRAV